MSTRICEMPRITRWTCRNAVKRGVDTIIIRRRQRREVSRYARFFLPTESSFSSFFLPTARRVPVRLALRSCRARVTADDNKPAGRSACTFIPLPLAPPRGTLALSLASLDNEIIAALSPIWLAIAITEQERARRNRYLAV